ncbi:SC6A3-like protein [Mya arenaria]|uniref:SC6A3-like protein n=1 Tax=Mya arenaria TaxID=6604 RepID=A0ABY7EGM5_MYAAR|nr:SC6A3-like protein [Mya arenaria]
MMNAGETSLELQRLNGEDINAAEIGADVNYDIAKDSSANVSARYNGDYVSGSHDSSSTGPEVVRETWSGRFEFLLSVVGYTVGMGNIWRFPYFVKRNGGGVALIPFLLFLVSCGGPLYYIEVCLGQFSGKSPVNVWDICPLFRGLGDTVIVCFADGFTGFFGGLVVFSVLGFLAKETGVSIDDLPFSGRILHLYVDRLVYRNLQHRVRCPVGDNHHFLDIRCKPFQPGHRDDDRQPPLSVSPNRLVLNHTNIHIRK